MHLRCLILRELYVSRSMLTRLLCICPVVVEIGNTKFREEWLTLHYTYTLPAYLSNNPYCFEKLGMNLRHSVANCTRFTT